MDALNNHADPVRVAGLTKAQLRIVMRHAQLRAVGADGLFLQQIPKMERSYDICLAAVQQNGLALEFVPANDYGRVIGSRLMNLVAEAIRQNPRAIQFIPPFITDHEITHFVLTHPAALEFLPERFRTHAFYLSIVFSQSTFIQYIPPEFQTDKLCLLAIKRSLHVATVFEHMHNKSEDRCVFLVQNWWTILSVMSRELQTPRVCRAALDASGGQAIHCIKEQGQNPRACMAAIELGNATAFSLIRDKTPELCMAAVQFDADSLQFVPPEVMTEDMCLMAVKQRGYTLRWVPPALKTPRVIKVAFKQSGLAIRGIPPAEQTTARCLRAVFNDPRAMIHISTPTTLVRVAAWCTRVAQRMVGKEGIDEGDE